MGFPPGSFRDRDSGVSKFFFYAAVKFALLSIVALGSRSALFAHISAVTFYVDIAHSIPVMTCGRKDQRSDFSIGYS